MLIKNLTPYSFKFSISLIIAIALLLTGCSGATNSGGGSGSKSGSFNIGGTASGLSGTLVLQDNGSDNLHVTSNGSFNFSTTVPYGNPYNVSVLTQPALQACYINSGTGTITANVNNVSVACASQKGGAMQGLALNLTPTVSTLVGTALGSDGTGGAARFDNPGGVTSDGTNLYVADSNNNKIRKIVIATGVVTTLAGSGVPGAADGIGPAATFNGPNGITTYGGNLYVADTFNNSIRKIVIWSGEVTTLAAPVSAYNAITNDGTNLYVADASNIYQIVIATGAVTTLVTGSFSGPYGISAYGGNLYVADTGNNVIRKIVITSGGVSISTLAGSGAAGADDATGTLATFDSPSGIVTTDGINLYVTEWYNNKIRKIDIASGLVSSVTGAANTPTVAGAADGPGSGVSFNLPQGISSDGTNLYIADLLNNTIRKFTLSTNTAATLAGIVPGANGTGAAADFSWVPEITTDGSNMYAVDTVNNAIRKVVIETGVITTFAGGGVGVVPSGSNCSGLCADGTGTAASFQNPNGITTDGTNLYVADTNNGSIRKVVIATGAVTTLVGSFATGSLYGITTDGINLYMLDGTAIRQIVIATGVVTTLAGGGVGALDAVGTLATFDGPRGITTDGTNLYVADTVNNKIRKVVIATGQVSSLTGPPNAAAVAAPECGLACDGTAAAATFQLPYGITTDGSNLYVADVNNNKVRKIDIATGTVSSLTGPPNGPVYAGGTDGAGAAASFNGPTGITTDGNSLYVSDYNNRTIRKIQ